jgi:hypothetical protein
MSEVAFFKHLVITKTVVFEVLYLFFYLFIFIYFFIHEIS